ncbi:leucyl aminopeptidase [Candidatus Woesearchaeota archaeon]|nr:leucyl aminopeptidase [Candidatus Woesearchaeota archaeon]
MITIKQQPDSNVLIIPLFKGKVPKLNTTLSKILYYNKTFAEEDKFNTTFIERETIIFAGLGEENKLTQEKARIFGSKVYGFLKSKEIKEASLIEFSSKAEILQGFAEGWHLAGYAFDKYKKEKEKRVENLTYVSKEKKLQENLDNAAKITEGVMITRDLVNEIPSTAHPKYIADYTKKLFVKSSKVKVKILGKPEIERLKMGCLLGVSRGSPGEPQVVIIEYTGLKSSKKHHVLVGKGVTYDSGGLNLKPTGFLETMKDDMGGAAAIIGAIKAIENLNVPINITGILGCVENLIGSNAYKPGDVLISAAGKSVEVANTDAEGRLVLSDCLHYATTLKPEAIIDLATLTGAALVVMGKNFACVMGNNQKMINEVIKAGEECHERSWELPLYDEFKEDIKGSIADLKNLGKPKGEAGTIAGGIFLQEFVDKYPWVHIDIAGPVWSDSQKNYIPEGATGFGVRLLVQHFTNLTHK